MLRTQARSLVSAKGRTPDIGGGCVLWKLFWGTSSIWSSHGAQAVRQHTQNTRTPPHTAHNPHFANNLLSYYRNTCPNGTDRRTYGQLDNRTATEHARVIIYLWITNSIALWPIKLGQFMNWWHNLHLCCGFSFEILQFSQFMLRCTLRVIRIVRFRIQYSDRSRRLSKDYWKSIIFSQFSAVSADRASVLFLLHTWLVCLLGFLCWTFWNTFCLLFAAAFHLFSLEVLTKK